MSVSSCPCEKRGRNLVVIAVQMDAAVLGDRLPEGTQKPVLGQAALLWGAPFLPPISPKSL